jgi:hypothetical protein
MILLNAAQSRELDRISQEKYAISSYSLLISVYYNLRGGLAAVAGSVPVHSAGCCCLLDGQDASSALRENGVGESKVEVQDERELEREDRH